MAKINSSTAQEAQKYSENHICAVLAFPVKQKDPLDLLVARYRRGEIAGLFIAMTTKAGEVEQLELMNGEVAE